MRLNGLIVGQLYLWSLNITCNALGYELVALAYLSTWTFQFLWNKNQSLKVPPNSRQYFYQDMEVSPCWCVHVYIKTSCYWSKVGVWVLKPWALLQHQCFQIHSVNGQETKEVKNLGLGYANFILFEDTNKLHLSTFSLVEQTMKEFFSSCHNVLHNQYTVVSAYQTLYHLYPFLYPVGQHEGNTSSWSVVLSG